MVDQASVTQTTAQSTVEAAKAAVQAMAAAAVESFLGLEVSQQAWDPNYTDLH